MNDEKIPSTEGDAEKQAEQESNADATAVEGAAELVKEEKEEDNVSSFSTAKRATAGLNHSVMSISCN